MHVGSEGWTNRQATLAQIAEKVHACSDRKVSEYTEDRRLLLFGQQKGEQY